MYSDIVLPKRYSKSQIFHEIQMICFNSTGVTPSSVVKIEEIVPQLRHSCLLTGVCFLPQYNWQFMSDIGVVNIPYYFCPKCGKLYIYNNFG